MVLDFSAIIQMVVPWNEEMVSQEYKFKKKWLLWLIYYTWPLAQEGQPKIDEQASILCQYVKNIPRPRPRWFIYVQPTFASLDLWYSVAECWQ